MEFERLCGCEPIYRVVRCPILGVEDNGNEVDNENKEQNANNGHSKDPGTMRTINVLSTNDDIGISSDIPCLHKQYPIVYLSGTHSSRC